jgi:hypothetical protein
VCYLREATVDLTNAEPNLDDCSAYGGRILRSASEGSTPAAALPTTGGEAGAPAKPGFSTSYAEAGAEYKGKVYASFPSIDAQKCKASCLMDFRCSNWVLGLCTDGSGLQAHVCYLKTASGEPEHEHDECAAFGGTVKRVAPSRTDVMTVHHHIPAVNYRSFATTSRYICQSTCEADQRCASWVHGQCASTEAGAHECYLNTASQPQWPAHDECAKFGGSVVRTAAEGYSKPTHVPTAEPSQPATAAPTEAATDAPEASPVVPADDQSCISRRDANGKVVVTCKHLVHHHVAHYITHTGTTHYVTHYGISHPANFVEQIHTQHIVQGSPSEKNIHITVHTPKVPAPKPAPAAPQEIHLVVHQQPGPPPPPAAPVNNIVTVGDNFKKGEVLNTPGLPKGVVEGSQEQGRHVIIHIDPKKDVTSKQKVINVDMKHKTPEQPQLVEKPQYNGLSDDANDAVVTPLANKNHNCQTTPTSAGNLIVTCTSLMN